MVTLDRAEIVQLKIKLREAHAGISDVERVYRAAGNADAGARCRALAYRIASEVEFVDSMLSQLPKMPIPVRVP
jgi:hypothetical protein